MKKIIFTYGLISGSIMGLMIIIFFGFMGTACGMNNAMLITYTTMVAAFSLVFFGTKNYRDNFSHGIISFGQAFKVGILISIVASVIYVVVWMIVQHFMLPDFYAQYASGEIEAARSAGASAAEIAETQKEMNDMVEMVKNPIVVFLFTFLEPLPVALLATLITSFALKRKTVSPVQ